MTIRRTHPDAWDGVRSGVPEPDPASGLGPLGAAAPGLPLFSINGEPVSTAWRQPALRRWLVGAAISILIWAGGVLPVLLRETRGGATWYLANLAAFVSVFAATPPLSWGKSYRVRLGWLVLLCALSMPFLFWPAMGTSGPWMWVYVAVACAMQRNNRTLTLATFTVLAAGSVAFDLAHGQGFSESLSRPAVILSIGVMMMAFNRQIETVRVLRATRHELAELAVAEERNRVARDMHDILGHSLTVIAVKAELAGRLLEAAPEKAATEIGDIEALARGALEDVRATVSGYRGVNVISELANARAALDAAGITADLPGAADEVPARDRELFGWVLREGVTNVIRHSGATTCRVTMGARFLQVDDDGVGPGASAGQGCGEAGQGGSADGGGLQGSEPRGNAPHGSEPPGGPLQGNGLRGAAERAAARGAVLELGRSALGGWMLRVHT